MRMCALGREYRLSIAFLSIIAGPWFTEMRKFLVAPDTSGNRQRRTEQDQALAEFIEQGALEQEHRFVGRY